MKILVIALSLFILSGAQANLKSQVQTKVANTGACLAMLAEPLIKMAVKDSSNQSLKMFDQDTDNPVDITLGKRFGAGYFGSFYAVEKSNVPVLNRAAFSVGVKIPHLLGVTDYALGYAKRESEVEWALYSRFQKAIPLIEQQAEFPQNPAWRRGVLPIIPIIHQIKTRQGRILFKPIIKDGVFLPQLAKEFKESGKLPEKYVQAIHEVYDLVQALYKATGVSPDIRPSNWVFVDKPEVLEIFGLIRPGFLLFEMSQVPFNLPKYIVPENSFQAFLKEFEGYLK